MIEHESNFEPVAVERKDGADGGALYDFSKFLTTIALVVLGGILTLAEAADDNVTNKGGVAIVIISVGFSGAFAVTAAASLAKLRTWQVSKWITPHVLLNAALFSLSVGVGVFLAIWQKSL